MLANINNILVATAHELMEDEPSSALAYALSFARAAEARLTVRAATVRLVLAHALVSNMAAGLLAAERRRIDAVAATAADKVREEARLAGVCCVTESPHLAYGELVDSFVAEARVHDLAVLDAEPSSLSVDRGLIEAAVFDTGRPLLLVPRGSETFCAARMAIAWDGSARAARALNDALPLLRAAEVVDIVSVSGEKDLTHTVPGERVVPHLAAHGIEARAVSLAAIRGDVAETLRRYAADARIDMIVMGAFVHSWLRHMILGGVTQSLLKAPPTPLFLSY